MGEELRYGDQMKAAKGVHFIPYSQCPLTTVRKDCIYYSTPAMVVPKAFENLHSCEVIRYNLLLYTILKFTFNRAILQHKW